jgi:hypothetical protein
VTASLSLISESPRPLWLVSLPSARHPYHEVPLLRQIEILYHDCSFRGTHVRNWRRVLRTGIDVDPSSAVIYAEFFEKALEYGDWPKLILALRRKCLRPTFKEVPSSTPEDELAKLREEYPTTVLSEDGKTIWLSRLFPDDPRVASVYESAYARWIPGDAILALAAAFLLVRPEDTDTLQAVLESSAKA